MSWAMRMIKIRPMNPCLGDLLYDTRYTYHDSRITTHDSRYTIHDSRLTILFRCQAIEEDGYNGEDQIGDPYSYHCRKITIRSKCLCKLQEENVGE